LSTGKDFEQAIETSANEQSIWYFRVRDVNVPPDLRNRIKIPQNKYDSLLFYKDHLFPIEMKSTKDKRFSFSESIIKQHQIDNLLEASKFDGVISGFLFNFRIEGNPTYFVDINSFIEYKNVAQNELTQHIYKSKINKASISLNICMEIGVEVGSVLKKVKHRYFISMFLDQLIEKYHT
jgi:penicillin-binding protein-related factor A (putative recombinase)